MLTLGFLQNTMCTSVEFCFFVFFVFIWCAKWFPLFLSFFVLVLKKT